MTKLTFLGTAGGRFATVFQKRATGGIYVTDKGIMLHLDPGPGALVRMHELGLDPTKTDALLISHCHPDHYTDAEVLIEGMTRGGIDNKGVLIGSESVISGFDNIGPAVSKYHLGLLAETHKVAPGDRIRLGEWYEAEATPTQHSDPTTVGFKLHMSEGTISYVSDTAYFEGLAEAHKGSRLMVICMTRPLNARIPYHLCTEDVVELVKIAKPKLAVITHMGMKILKGDPSFEANWIAEETGIPTIAARDYMSIYLGDKIEIKRMLPVRNP
ncbi:MAG: MBL fold metallo-hydrolase [Thermoplasmata archaeon HGW-Thermoplasmata-1]|nr:MAG: MBL fold metallo-hydrolase [Thermoplasmata archaeon HGW-Thermoplasmata-1]